MDVDAAVDRLAERMRREGLKVPGPVDADEVAGVEAELAPLRLPEDYRRFLARMRPDLPLQGFPTLHDLAFAVESWRGQQQFGIPRVLFTIAYTSHFWLATELASDVSPGGELFCWSAGDDYARLEGRLPGFLAALADAPADAPVDPYGALRVDVDVDTLRSGRTVGWESDTWPAHWLAAEGFTAGDLEVRGGTATVAELLAARDLGSVRERVQVEVTGLVAMAGESIVTVSDGSGSMVLRWPVAAGPARAQAGRSFELDVHSAPWLRSDTRRRAEADRAHREASERALRGDVEGAQRAVERFGQARQRQGVDGDVVAARRLPADQHPPSSS